MAPRFTTASEQEVWEQLRDTLPLEAVLLANLRLTDATHDHEADLVVLLPGTGVVVVEVKGGSVWRDAEGESREPSVRERSRERLYVGMSRATDLLVVVGDPGTVRGMGGDQVARHLGI